MAFTLEQTIGKGNGTVKVTATPLNEDQYDDVEKYVNVYANTSGEPQLKGRVLLRQKGRERILFPGKLKVSLKDVNPSGGTDVGGSISSAALAKLSKTLYTWVELDNGDTRLEDILVTRNPIDGIPLESESIQDQNVEGYLRKVVKFETGFNFSKEELHMDYEFSYGDQKLYVKLTKESCNYDATYFSNSVDNLNTEDRTITLGNTADTCTLYAWVVKNGVIDNQGSKFTHSNVDGYEPLGVVTSTNWEMSDSEGRNMIVIPFTKNDSSNYRAMKCTFTYTEADFKKEINITLIQEPSASQPDPNRTIKVNFYNQSRVSSAAISTTLKLTPLNGSVPATSVTCKSTSTVPNDGSRMQNSFTVDKSVLPATVSIQSIDINGSPVVKDYSTISPTTVAENMELTFTYKDS